MDETYINSKTSNKEKEPNYKTFYSKLFYIILTIIISIIIGSIFLYMSKISQTNIINTVINILDTSKDKDKDKDKDTTQHINKEIDVNIVKQYSGFFGKLGLGFLSSKKPEVYTTKVLFNDNIENINKTLKILLNLKNKVYGKSISQTEYNKLKNEQNTLANKKIEEENNKNPEKKKKNTEPINNEPINNESNTFFYWYIYNVIFQTLSTSLWLLNSIFNLFGKNLSESVILIIFSFFSGVFIILIFITIFYLTIFYAIINFLKIYDSRIPGIISTEIKEIKEIKKTEFKFEFTNFSKIFTYSNLFLFFMLFFGILFITGISLFNFCYIIYIFLNNTGKIVAKNQNFNFIDLCKSTFKYKSQVIMLLFSYKLYNDVVTNLGNTYIWSFFIALLLFLIFTNVFNSYTYSAVDDPNLTSGFSNNETSSETTSPKTTEKNISKTPVKSKTTEEISSGKPASTLSVASKTTLSETPKTTGEISTGTPEKTSLEAPKTTGEFSTRTPATTPFVTPKTTGEISTEKLETTVKPEITSSEAVKTTGGGKLLECKNLKKFKKL